MDFTSIFASGSGEARVEAVRALATEGRSGYRYLSALMEAVSEIDLEAHNLADAEVTFVAYSARTMGSLVNDFGFDVTTELHITVLDWLCKNTTNRNIRVALWAVYGLGDLGVPPDDVRFRLERLVGSDLRPDEFPYMSLRGVAFRVLVKVDRSSASRLRHSVACEEFIAGMDRFTTMSDDRESTKFQSEIEWLLVQDS